MLAITSVERKALTMDEILTSLGECIKRGKINLKSSYPPDLRGQKGAYELAKDAIDAGIPPQILLSEGLIAPMQYIGERFRNREIFVPDVLLSAKAMSAAMEHLKPLFQADTLKRKGKVVLGTVAGDLHDIGKRLVGMIVEGAGWEVIDLGTDVPTDRFLKAIEEHPGCVVGMSALLTTTMENMGRALRQIKTLHPQTKVIIGGAPVTQEFAAEVGADAYSPDPQGAVEYLNTHCTVT